MNIEFFATIDATDRIIATPVRLLEDSSDSKKVVLTIGDIVLHIPHTIAGEVERKIATALEAFR